MNPNVKKTGRLDSSPVEEDEKRQLIERIAQSASELEGASDLMIAYVSLWSEQVPLRQLRRQSIAQWLSRAMSIFRLAQERQPGELKTRVYDPADRGAPSEVTVIDIVNDDMPFLVDSIVSALTALDVEVLLLIHPVVSVLRQESGRLVALDVDGDSPERANESHMQIHVRRQAKERFAELEQRIRFVLRDVRAAVEDWPQMRRRLHDVIEGLRERQPPGESPEDVAEAIAFLRWLDEDHFTYLGWRQYSFEGSDEEAVARVEEGGLGILRDDQFTVFEGLRHLGQLPSEVRQFVHEPHLLRIMKANRRSVVHRQAYLDAISIKSLDGRGDVIGERLFVGLFTSTAYSCRVSSIPILRRKVDRVLEWFGFPTGSHNARTLEHLLETHPRDELYQATEQELVAAIARILELQERQRIALIVRLDPFERFASCLVYVPRERFDTALRRRFEEILASAFGGSAAIYYTLLTDEPLARLHIILRTTPGEVPKVDLDELEERLVEAGESWASRLERALRHEVGDVLGMRLAGRYREAFPASYTERYGAETAAKDVVAVEQVLAGERLALRLYRRQTDPPTALNLKIFLRGALTPLSDVLPRLACMGLRVVYENAHALRPREATEAVWIRELEMTTEGGHAVDIEVVREDFYDTLRSVWYGEIENDPFNSLVTFVGLKRREVNVLRAYARLLKQLRVPFSQEYIQTTLAAQPEITRSLVDLFMLRFDPETEERKSQSKERSKAIRQSLDGVTSLDEDRILRRFLNAIESTLRTNYFQSDAMGLPKPYLSLKLDSTRLANIPEPRPWREIWVYSPSVEAIHLRGGPVARGGVRYSNRPEDFRTEVLGLMKAQMVKNAVIVPVGSKGGFVVKDLSEDRQQAREQVVACYRTMIRGLLDLTDSRNEDGEVVAASCVRWDDDDPYLVVAADKGTATFSDIANEISSEYGFWLDDAFASGGSVGYDHKKMGITARGAWESVKRHFRELGKDIQSEEFTVVGVGDMSGDVFGNGMLLSNKTRLVAAFNHLHIFIDPNPDPESSFQERQRLFEIPGSSWADYDPGRISKGGGVFSRSQKSIQVTEEMAVRFGISEMKLNPADLIRCLLRSKTELLWFAGIGTYVKASTEANRDVGDRANDSLRINGAEVCAQVIGEGANLAMTQRGRIECAARGCRLNTDFVDNSAGVDCSDHEVNLKVLFGHLLTTGRVSRKQRDGILRSVEEEVAALVLRDSYLQGQAISVAQQLGTLLTDRLARVLRSLERSGHLDRTLENLPSDDMLEEREAKGQGFTRPELAILQAYSKLSLYEEILASSVPEESFLGGDLLRYFPAPLRREFEDAIGAHRLRREIISTLLANEVVNRAGIVFADEVSQRTSRSRADVVRFFVASREVLGMEAMWRQIEELDGVAPAVVQLALLADCGRLIERCTVWMSRVCDGGLAIDELIDRYQDGVRDLGAQMRQVLSEPVRAKVEDELARLLRSGVPEELASRLVCMKQLGSGFDAVWLAAKWELPIGAVARIYFAVGERFGFDWMRRATSSLRHGDVWEKLATGSLLEDLYGDQAALCERVLETSGSDGSIEAWVAQHRHGVEETERLLSEMQGRALSLAHLSVAARALRSLARS